MANEVKVDAVSIKAKASKILLEKKKEIEDQLSKLTTCQCETSGCDCIQIFHQISKEEHCESELDLTTSNGESSERGHVASKEDDSASRAGIVASGATVDGPSTALSSWGVQGFKELFGSKDLMYKMKTASVLIFQMFAFDDGGRKVESWADGQRLVQFFEERAGFQVLPCFNLDAAVVVDVCKQHAQNQELENCDGLIVVITTHGDEHGIYGSDGKQVNVDDIVEPFRNNRCEHLFGKPKLFFVEACRGTGIDPGVCHMGPKSHSTDLKSDAGSFEENCPSLKLPADSDVLIMYSTTSGNRSYGYVMEPDHKIPFAGTGSWFITILVNILNSYGDKEDLSTLLLRVNQEVSKLGNTDNRKQICCQMSMLRHKVHFVFQGKEKVVLDSRKFVA